MQSASNPLNVIPLTVSFIFLQNKYYATQSKNLILKNLKCWVKCNSALWAYSMGIRKLLLFNVNSFEWNKDLWVLVFIILIQNSKISNINDLLSIISFAFPSPKEPYKFMVPLTYVSIFFVVKRSRVTNLINSFGLMSFCLSLKEFLRVFLLHVGCNHNAYLDLTQYF